MGHTVREKLMWFVSHSCKIRSIKFLPQNLANVSMHRSKNAFQWHSHCGSTEVSRRQLQWNFGFSSCLLFTFVVVCQLKCALHWLLCAGALEALLVSSGLTAPPGGLAAHRPQQLYSLFNADVPVTDLQVRMTEVADNFRRLERQSDSSRVIGARDRALRVAFRSLADNMHEFSASCQLTADLITYASSC